MAEEFPPLLTTGWHPTTLAALREMCVDAFPLSTTRPQIMTGLETVIERLVAVGIRADAWIDGSFLTEKINPKDSDVVFRVDAEFCDQCTQEQYSLLEWVAGQEPQERHLCDAYLHVDYPAGHTRHAHGEWMRAYWIKQFGFSREEEMKGIAVVTL
ncbi:MAG: hypothetical protein HY208_05905 [Nitrospirae bacterium]|nr:hypothetical protein [Nitrospirota bacterium]